MIRAARFTGPPNRSLSRRSTMPRWTPQRTRSGSWCCASSSASERCSVTVALTASSGSAKAAYMPSPIIFTTTPELSATVARASASCAASARDIFSLSCSHSRELPSMSVKRMVVTFAADCTQISADAACQGGL
jgi:hypothetical protein